MLVKSQFSHAHFDSDYHNISVFKIPLFVVAASVYHVIYGRVLSFNCLFDGFHFTEIF